MNIFTDDRIVLTLDAGGTNFVFSAMQAGTTIVEPITYPSNAHELNLCLKTVIRGFEQVQKNLHQPAVAISFAFPGPADYRSGIIGNLPNLPAFQGGGVALGPMLEDYFKLPTFIGNDGDLFTYGESLGGVLPAINDRLKNRNINKIYKNLLGVTLGTGFGGGLVINNQLCEGDNAAGGEIWLSRNFRNPRLIAEEGASIRAIRSTYRNAVKDVSPSITPKDIYEIAIGKQSGDQQAALNAFDEMALVIAETLCNAITLIDGIIVIGGGLSGAYSLLAPKIVAHMNGTIENSAGIKLPRLVSKVYDLEDPQSLDHFLFYEMKTLTVPFSQRTVTHTFEKRIAISESRLGTSKAVALGAYAIALQKLSSSDNAYIETLTPIAGSIL